jgi:adenylate kinase
LGACIKTIYLTGAPASGKSTTLDLLLDLTKDVAVWEYGNVLRDYINRKSIDKVSHDKLRESSAAIVTPADIAAIDEELIEFVAENRGKKHILIGSHPVTREDYGFRCTAFSHDQILAINPNEIWVLYANPSETVERIKSRSGGRKTVNEEEAQMHTFLQSSVALSYGISVGCPVYFFESNSDQNFLIERLHQRLGK